MQMYLILHALLKALKKHDAHHGCAIIMDVKTGAIRAIANIGKTRAGDYWENYNYAIGESTEPGSTFKLAAMMAMFEDGLIELDDSINIKDGFLKVTVLFPAIYFIGKKSDFISRILTHTVPLHFVLLIFIFSP